MTAPGGEIDISKCNTLVLRGYLQSGRNLMVRLVQPDVKDWLGWGELINGTGEAWSEYRIALPAGQTMPDLIHTDAVKFEAPGPYLTSVKFTFRQVFAIKEPVLMHTSFKVTRKASTVWLLDAHGIRDSIAYPDMQPGVAWGYDSLGALGYLSVPTPWGRSISGALPAVTPAAKPVQDAGFYATPISVSVDIPVGTEVHYTLDGAIPTALSPIYSAPLLISQTTVLRTVALQAGALTGKVSTRSYFIGDTARLPVVSVVTDPAGLFSQDSGIYALGVEPGSATPYWGANFWAPKEIPVSVEFFETGGVYAWRQDAGMSIFGNYSRANDKKSMSIAFRECYGKNSLTYPLFPNHPEMEEFKAFGLRSGGGNASTDYIRDALAQNLTEGLDVDHQYNRAVVVYYNGEYFGIHRLMLKMDPDYPVLNRGVSENSLDFIEAYGAPRAGSGLSLEDLKTYMNANDMNTAASFAKVDSLIDLNEYLSYLATEVYSNNTDWPANNWRAWRSNSPQSKWRWMFFDVDFGFGSPNGGESVDFDMFPFITDSSLAEDAWPNGSGSTRIIRGLFANEAIKNMFINRMTVLLNTKFTPARVNAMIDSMMAEVTPEMPKDLDRWNQSETQWLSSLAVIQEFATQREGYVRNYMRNFFGLGVDVYAALSTQGAGGILVDGVVLPNPCAGNWYTGQVITLEALPQKGATFAGWSDGVMTAKRSWTPTNGAILSAEFR